MKEIIEKIKSLNLKEREELREAINSCRGFYSKEFEDDLKFMDDFYNGYFYFGESAFNENEWKNEVERVIPVIEKHYIKSEDEKSEMEKNLDIYEYIRNKRFVPKDKNEKIYAWIDENRSKTWFKTDLKMYLTLLPKNEDEQSETNLKGKEMIQNNFIAKYQKELEGLKNEKISYKYYYYLLDKNNADVSEKDVVYDWIEERRKRLEPHYRFNFNRQNLGSVSFKKQLVNNWILQEYKKWEKNHGVIEDFSKHDDTLPKPITLIDKESEKTTIYDVKFRLTNHKYSEYNVTVKYPEYKWTRTENEKLKEDFFQKFKREMTDSDVLDDKKFVHFYSFEKDTKIIQDELHPYVEISFRRKAYLLSEDEKTTITALENERQQVVDYLKARNYIQNWTELEIELNKSNLMFKIDNDKILLKEAYEQKRELSSYQRKIVNDIWSKIESEYKTNLPQPNVWSGLVKWDTSEGSRTEGEYFLNTKEICLNKGRVDKWSDNNLKAITTHEMAHYIAYKNKKSFGHCEKWLQTEFELNKIIFNEKIARCILEANIFKYGTIMRDCPLKPLKDFAIEKKCYNKIWIKNETCEEFMDTPKGKEFQKLRDSKQWSWEELKEVNQKCDLLMQENLDENIEKYKKQGLNILEYSNLLVDKVDAICSAFPILEQAWINSKNILLDDEEKTKEEFEIFGLFDEPKETWQKSKEMEKE